MKGVIGEKNKKNNTLSNLKYFYFVTQCTLGRIHRSELVFRSYDYDKEEGEVSVALSLYVRRFLAKSINMENNPHIIHAPTLHSHIHRLFTAKTFIHLCSCTQHKHTQHHKSSVDVCSPSHPTPLLSDFPRLTKKKHQQKLASMVNNTDSVAQRNLISSSVRVNLEPIFSFSLVLPLLRCSDHKIRDCEIKKVYETKDRNYRCSWIPFNFSFKYNQLNC